MSDLKREIQNGIISVSKHWTKVKNANARKERLEERDYEKLYKPPAKVHLTTASEKWMEYAYNMATDNGEYYTTARQIMYPIRPKLFKETGETELKTEYFTQTLLKKYLEKYKPDWKIVWDARGHFSEPHTEKRFGVGGLEVMRYLDEWKREDITSFDPPRLNDQLRTYGPANRFKNILFIEKEGFYELLQHTKIQERFDIAIMSNKGIPVGAGCTLSNALYEAGCRVFVLRDFDYEGFKIVRNLRKGVRLSPGTKVIDLGFRIDDIRELESEPRKYTKYHGNVKAYLRRCKATEEEIDFLYTGYRRGQRVELNAMTTGQLVKWLESKFEEHGVTKFIPDSETLSQAYKLINYRNDIQEAINQVEFTDIDVPKDLEERIQDIFIKRPEISWDEAIWRILKGD